MISVVSIIDINICNSRLKELTHKAIFINGNSELCVIAGQWVMPQGVNIAFVQRTFSRNFCVQTSLKIIGNLSSKDN